ncbi:MAG: CotH kinase family protein [Defluviitaleaceae bacterium]|nr:CotH kinase family protein [Defluviitaleaceae bacterium]
MTTKHAILLYLAAITLFLTACNAAQDAQAAQNPTIYSTSATFPAVHITTNLPIDRRNWETAEITLSNASNADFHFTAETGRIRGRGNSSWLLEKQPFRIRFDEPRTMLDSDHAARDWTFIANHSDKSLLRNYSAYHLASLLDGMNFAPFARFVDVYFNGEYQGVYMLSIQIQVIPGRAELTYHADPALSEFLFEMDWHVVNDDDSEEGVTFVTVNGRHYDILFPSGENLTLAHVEYLREYITKVEQLAIAQDNAIFDYIHLPSFVDFYIVQEFYKNVDVESSSVFMQLRGQGAERRLEMGPVWDFDIAAGNAYFQGDTLDGYPYGYSPHGLWTAWVHLWYRNLMQMPVFFDAVATRWNAIRDVEIRQNIDHINATATRYQAAFERNFDRWQIMGEYIRPNPPELVEIDTFMGQVEYLVNFLEVRKIGFDQFLNFSVQDTQNPLDLGEVQP